MNYNPVDPSLIFKSSRPDDPRLGDFFKSVSHDELTKAPSLKTFVISGYPDDDGIKANRGRPGAELGPKHIRKYFYKMTPAATTERPPQILDLGDLKSNGDLKNTHELALATAEKAYQNGYTWVGIGGGHDYAYPDIAGFLRTTPKNVRPLVINFDAHLDVRPLDQGINSGTAFFRLLSEFREFDFAQIGIQAQCNAKAHLGWTREQGGRILTYDDALQSGLSFSTFCLERLSDWLMQRRPCFLSIDLDAFSSAYAPGCSQSWPMGLEPGEFMKLASVLKRRMDVRGFGIYECSPPLDIDDRTAKLAAVLLHQFVHS